MADVKGKGWGGWAGPLCAALGLCALRPLLAEMGWEGDSWLHNTAFVR